MFFYPADSKKVYTAKGKIKKNVELEGSLYPYDEHSGYMTCKSFCISMLLLN